MFTNYSSTVKGLILIRYLLDRVQAQTTWAVGWNEFKLNNIRFQRLTNLIKIFTSINIYCKYFYIIVIALNIYY